MGMPISSYSIFKALSSGSEVLKTQDAIKAIKPFNLYGFILHDPEEHLEFHNYLNSEFDRLDYITGEKFLFFSLTDPPEDWLMHASGRDYFRTIRNFEAREMVSPWNSIRSKNPSSTVLSIINDLKIPYESLPCIVIMSNLNIKKFVWYKTSSHAITEQFTRLGYIAQRSQQFPYRERINIIYDLISKENLNLCQEFGEVELIDKLCTTLANTLSAVTANSDINPEIKKEAHIHAKSNLRDLYNKISEFKKNKNDFLEYKYYESIEKLSLAIVTYESNFIKMENNIEYCPLKLEYLEPDCKVILKTANIVYNALKNNTTKQNYDFTPITICFAKIFEKEINLSQVHWIRRQLEITLPEYYNLYQPNMNAIITIGEKSTDFNMACKDNKNKWFPPPMGNSRVVWNKMIKKELPKGWSESDIKNLYQKWNDICSIRNSAAHTELVDFKMNESLYKDLIFLEENGVFKLLNDMKQELRRIEI